MRTHLGMVRFRQEQVECEFRALNQRLAKEPAVAATVQASLDEVAGLSLAIAAVLRRLEAQKQSR